MTIQEFKITVAVPNYMELLSVDDIHELFAQTGEERMDLNHCSVEVTEVSKEKITSARNKE